MRKINNVMQPVSNVWLGCMLFLGTLLLNGCGREISMYQTETEEQVIIDQTSRQSEEQVETDTTTACYVYVCGEVNAPGVYTFACGSRICDAIDSAGGMTSEASSDYWNLAKPLTDGDMIYVPSVEEASEMQRVPESGNGVESTDANDGKVNLNTASKEQLMTIPGVGEAKADSILTYRKEHGDFASVEELTNVAGIKDGIYSKMKEYITIN